MAISASITSGAGGAIWQQLQSQQAQRVADQAAQTAQSLQAQARDARVAAQRAQETARSLEIEAGQAQAKATQASLGVQSAKSFGEMQTQQADVYAKLPQMVGRSAATPTQTAPSTTPVPTTTTVSSGQAAVGTVINTTA